MKRYKISKIKLFEILKPDIPLNENTETQIDITDNGLVTLALLRDTGKYHDELTTKGYLHEGKLTVKGETIINTKDNIERLKGLL